MSNTIIVTAVAIRDIESLKLAVKELQAAGINCSLVEKAVPRLYYPEQLQKSVADGGLGRSTDVCDYVLKLDDSPYDVGFIKDEHGVYRPVFDDFTLHRATTKYKDVQSVLGVPFNPAKVNAKMKPADMAMHKFVEQENYAYRIGKLTRAYSKHNAHRIASKLRKRITKTEEKDGRQRIHISA